MTAKDRQNARVSEDNSGTDPAFIERLELVVKRVGNATKLAEETGIGRRTIGHYLAGQAEPSRLRLVAMADAADVDVAWLATGKGPMERDARAGRINDAALEAAIAAVEEMLASQKWHASPAKKASLIKAVYNLRIMEGE